MQKLKPVKEIQPEYFLKKKRNHFLISSFVNSMTSLGLVYSVLLISYREGSGDNPLGTSEALGGTLAPFDFFLPFVWFLKLVECASLIME